MLNTERVAFANDQLKKVLKYLITSGVALTALSATVTSLGALQGGVINLNVFLTGLAFTVGFAFLNAAIYWVKQYTDADKQV